MTTSGDLTLRNALAAAHLLNPELRAEAWKPRLAEASRLQAGLSPNPECSLELEYFAGAAAPDPLFAHVFARRSCKEPFEDRAVLAERIERLASYAAIVHGRDKVDELIDLTWNAWLTEANTWRTMKESVDLMRMGRAEIEANPDGIDLGGPFLESLMLLGVLTREAQLDPDSSGFRLMCLSRS